MLAVLHRSHIRHTARGLALAKIPDQEGTTRKGSATPAGVAPGRRASLQRAGYSQPDGSLRSCGWYPDHAQRGSSPVGGSGKDAWTERVGRSGA